MAWITKTAYVNGDGLDTSTIGSYDSVSVNDSNTISSPIRSYEYPAVHVPRRCLRCRMFNWETEACKRKKKAEDCRKSYSIKKQK